MSAAIEGSIAGTDAVNTPDVDETVVGAVIETPVVTAVIQDRLASADRPVTTEMLVSVIKRVEDQLRKSYPDPTRITTPAVNPLNMVIHQDFRRDVDPIPRHVTHPRVALIKGKPLQVSSYTVPATYGRDGEVLKSAYEVPVYAAAGPDGNPWKDDADNYLVIDPQNGAIRQRMVKKLNLRKSKGWFQVRWLRFKQWIKSIRFDFKIVKRK